MAATMTSQAAITTPRPDCVAIRVRDYTTTPGGRRPEDGPFPGSEFREKHVVPAFKEARRKGLCLVVDLDGTAGYASSFLEETFGGLAREFSISEVSTIVRVQSRDEPYLEEDVRQYIAEANDPR